DILQFTEDNTRLRRYFKQKSRRPTPSASICYLPVSQAHKRVRTNLHSSGSVSRPVWDAKAREIESVCASGRIGNIPVHDPPSNPHHPVPFGDLTGHKAAGGPGDPTVLTRLPDDLTVVATVGDRGFHPVSGNPCDCGNITLAML